MVFSSLVFLFLFLPVVLVLYYSTNSNRLRNYILLFSSLLFYAWGEPRYVLLILVSIIVNYYFGLRVFGSEPRRRLWLTASVAFNIGILVVFKYANFLADNISSIFGVELGIPSIPLPLGISFFTFQILSYVIDVYRNQGRVQRNIFDLALYISLFPQLVAGPIVRYQTIDDQINNRKHSLIKFAEGVNRFVSGLGKKVIFANQLGLVADGVFGAPISDLATAQAWLGIICYTLQIYFDFSGYSDMAIGLGKMFGFDFLENFNYPYISQSVSEFWRRWHISLGTWFKDYLYIPLGGNRVGPLKQYRNLFAVWAMAGIWHGASWTFMAWGLYYGILIAMEKAFLAKVLAKLPKAFRHLYLIGMVLIGWVFFRADGISQAVDYIGVLMGIGANPLLNNASMRYIWESGYLIALATIFSTPILSRAKEILKGCNPKLVEGNLGLGLHSVSLTTLFLVIVVLLVNSSYNPFLYFRF